MSAIEHSFYLPHLVLTLHVVDIIFLMLARIKINLLHESRSVSRSSMLDYLSYILVTYTGLIDSMCSISIG